MFGGGWFVMIPLLGLLPKLTGSGLGGLLASFAGPYVCFLVAAACLALAAGQIWRIRRPLQLSRPAVAVRPLAAVREALRYTWNNPRVLSLVTVKCGVGFGNGVLTA